MLFLTRLVLVTGPIGIGKTQVALRTADYASLRNCFDVITEVSLEVGWLPVESGWPPLFTLTSYRLHRAAQHR